MTTTEPGTRRVVVTGIGAVTSIGTGREPFWRALLAGQSGVSRVESFDVSELSVSIGAQVLDFDPGAFMSRRSVVDCGRASQLAIAASRLALEDAGLDPLALDEVRPLILIGTTMGESDAQEALTQAMTLNGDDSAARADVLRLPDSLVALNVAHELEMEADCSVFATACAAGNYAIGHGYDMIESGAATMVLAGGSDAFSRVSFIGFSRLNALAPRCCQPFDKNRQGIVIGEGAGVLILESLDHALARGATVYAEVLGYGLSCDANHMTIPHVDGIIQVVENALHSCGVAPEQVSAICAHGTGTPANDRAEWQALRHVFGERAGRIPVNSIKSMLGHTMGAASALEAIACVLTIHDGHIPPTINFETPDEECPADCVPNTMRSIDADIVLNNAFAFGANNAATVFARYRHEPHTRAVD